VLALLNEEAYKTAIVVFSPWVSETRKIPNLSK
jgi:hypothetical protein